MRRHRSNLPLLCTAPPPVTSSHEITLVWLGSPLLSRYRDHGATPSSDQPPRPCQKAILGGDQRGTCRYLERQLNVDYVVLTRFISPITRVQWERGVHKSSAIHTYIRGGATAYKLHYSLGLLSSHPGCAVGLVHPVTDWRISVRLGASAGGNAPGASSVHLLSAILSLRSSSRASNLSASTCLRQSRREMVEVVGGKTAQEDGRPWDG